MDVINEGNGGSRASQTRHMVDISVVTKTSKFSRRWCKWFLRQLTQNISIVLNEFLKKNLKNSKDFLFCIDSEGEFSDELNFETRED